VIQQQYERRPEGARQQHTGNVAQARLQRRERIVPAARRLLRTSRRGLAHFE
jgi:hypothetical protein